MFAYIDKKVLKRRDLSADSIKDHIEISDYSLSLDDIIDLHNNTGCLQSEEIYKVKKNYQSHESSLFDKSSFIRFDASENKLLKDSA